MKDRFEELSRMDPRRPGSNLDFPLSPRWALEHLIVSHLLRSVPHQRTFKTL